ncbi:uncharacterized protein PSFLO_01507 [Pseudozyma flocculosa]|nr:uncharacterized protein PSFLO_01507 [Pseudozyma flocculosa]
MEPPPPPHANGGNGAQAGESYGNGGGAEGDGDEDDDEVDFSLLPAEGMPETDKAKKAAEGLGDDAVLQKSIDLVRFSLACEYSKTAIKKDAVSKKILNGRQGAAAFPVIFNKAQRILRSTFGYTLVELRPAGSENQQLQKQNETVTQTADPESSSRGRAADKSKQSQREDAAKASSTTKSWALRSVLPLQLIGRLSARNDDLARALHAGGEDSAVTADETGTALDWKKADLQLGSIGLLYVILSLILLNGRAISQAQLLAYLRRLRLYPEARLPSKVQVDGAGHGGGDAATQGATQRTHHARGRRADGGEASLDEFLYLLRKQHYLERSRTDVVAAAGSTQATQRHATGSRMRDDEEGASYEWRWGSRAEAEVSEQSIAKMVEAIFHEDEATAGADEGEQHPDDAQVSRRRMAQRRESLLRDIETAAGSQLLAL